MFWKGKKVLVTGSSGMIGRELYEMLVEQGADVTPSDLAIGDDLRDYYKCLKLCSNHDYVFHLVGVKGSPKMTRERPAEFMSTMLIVDSNMIDAAQKSGVKGFLYTSSIAVENPETDLYPATAKLTAEMFINANRIQYPDGTKYCIVRPANVYGHESLHREDLMVVSSLIKQAIYNGKIILDNKGCLQIRDIIHAKDVARNMIKCIEEMPEYPVNLCSGKETQIKSIAEEIGRQLDIPIEYTNLNLTLGPSKKTMIQNHILDIKIDLKEGIADIVKHVKNKTI
jgi:GDP-L-fucose synthase